MSIERAGAARNTHLARRIRDQTDGRHLRVIRLMITARAVIIRTAYLPHVIVVVAGSPAFAFITLDGRVQFGSGAQVQFVAFVRI